MSAVLQCGFPATLPGPLQDRVAPSMPSPFRLRMIKKDDTSPTRIVVSARLQAESTKTALLRFPPDLLERVKLATDGSYGVGIVALVELALNHLEENGSVLLVTEDKSSPPEE